MQSFTPEMGKRFGRVVGWTEEVVVTIRPIFEGAEVDEEDLDWKEVQGEWKLLQ